MKVLYCISSVGHGRGGHFYSMKTTVRALSDSIDTAVINIGLLPSPVARDATNKYFFIFFYGINFPLAFLKFIYTLIHLKPNVLHAFDRDSFLFARISGILTGIPVIFTKCGGPNPTKYFPIADNFIVYSGEDYNFFQAGKRFNPCRIWYLPNRVSEVVTDKNIVSRMRQIAGDRLVLLRIARITPTYERSINQSLALQERLQGEGIATVLFIVGAVQNPIFYKKLCKETNPRDVIFFTDENITLNASKVIDAADCVIGTGRGLMEAASKGKIVLSPVDVGELPVLIDKSNINSFQYTNFSERNKFPQTQMESNFKELISILNDEQKLKEYKKFILEIYIKYFSIETAKKDYNNIYQRVTNYPASTHFIDIVVHSISTIKRFTSNYINKYTKIS